MLDLVGNRKSLTSTLVASPGADVHLPTPTTASPTTPSAPNGNTLTSARATYTYDFLDRLLGTSNGLAIVNDDAPLPCQQRVEYL